jgi:hypothetical protein
MVINSSIYLINILSIHQNCQYCHRFIIVVVNVVIRMVINSSSQWYIKIVNIAINSSSLSSILSSILSSVWSSIHQYIVDTSKLSLLPLTHHRCRQYCHPYCHQYGHQFINILSIHQNCQYCHRFIIGVVNIVIHIVISMVIFGHQFINILSILSSRLSSVWPSIHQYTIRVRTRVRTYHGMEPYGTIVHQNCQYYIYFIFYCRNINTGMA